MLPAQMLAATSSTIRLLQDLSKNPKCSRRAHEMQYLMRDLRELHHVAKYETANRMTPEQVRHLNAIRQSTEEIMTGLPKQELRRYQ